MSAATGEQTTKLSDRETTRSLVARLRHHYLGPDTAANRMPGGVFVDECGINGSTGTHDAPRNSRCDALYAGFTSASGRILVGHEVKVSMADWRKELDTAGKADTWADQCHAWYIVVPLDLAEKVRPDLPHGWGLMSPNPRTKTRMSVDVKAQVHPDRVPAWWAVRSFLARLDTQRAGREAQVERDLHDAVYAEFDKRYATRADNALTSTQRIRLDWIERLEEKLGRTIEGEDWSDQLRPEHIAAAVALTKASPKGLRHSARNLRETARSLADSADELEGAFAELIALGDATGRTQTTAPREQQA